MNKLTTFLREKLTEKFMSNWKSIIDLWHERERESAMIQQVVGLKI